ncbi:MAG: glycosyltransferase [Pseudomonadota bacterium]
MAQPRRIALFAPLPPTKSGIARHSAAIATALRAREGLEVKCYSFERQYPAWLYPGQAEVSESLAVFEGQQRVMRGANPLTWRRAITDISAFQTDISVFPAWTFALAPALGWMARRARRAGHEVVMVVHNAFDHEASPWKQRLSLWQLAPAHRFVTHNTALADQLRDHFPDKRVDVFPHPVFDDLPDATGTRPREAAMELLFFGIVRPYKGLDILLHALADCERRDIRLTIAGEFWSGEDDTRALVASLNLTDQVEMLPGFIDDNSAAELFHRADAVMLPYRSVTGSGVVATAYHYARPVVASDLPGLVDVVPNGCGWLVPPEDAAALAQVLKGLNRTATSEAGIKAKNFGRTLSWDSFAQLVLG